VELRESDDAQCRRGLGERRVVLVLKLQAASLARRAVRPTGAAVAADDAESCNGVPTNPLCP
jgi:hypothetical protein